MENQQLKFCPNCGKELPTIAVSFCPFCGKMLTNTSVQANQSENTNTLSNQENKQLASQLLEAKNVIVDAYASFNKIMDIQAEKMPIKVFIIGLLLSFIALLLGNHFLIVVTPIGVVAAALYMHIKESGKITQLKQNGCDMLKANSQTLSVVPKQYLRPSALIHICDLIDQNRFKDLPSALDECDNYLHRLQMEQTSSSTNTNVSGLGTIIGLSNSSVLGSDLATLHSAEKNSDARRFGATPIDRERIIYNTYVAPLTM